MSKIIFSFFIIFGFFAANISAEVADLIVAQDGSGDYTTIHEAVDAAPNNATDYFIILVKNGTYNEKIFIEKDFLALVGEDRDSTVIVISLLRDDWLAEHPGNDWGAATVNIANGVDDLVLANLTVKNNYAELHPDDPNKRAHCFAVRGGGNRVITVNSNFITGGGDTFSLWAHGYYYHKDCYFEGGVDYVCPRGWCYITDCDFYGYNTGASIWLDGRNDPDEKLVVRNSFFDGVKNFGLGRYHVDSQFYLLDCALSDNVNDNGGILYVGSEPSEYLYGPRIYYYNTHREGGDFDWHLDNLWEAFNLPSPEQITPSWTFRDEWDPETAMPLVLTFASMPKPGENEIKIDLNPQLSWITGRNAVSHDIYFGKNYPLYYKGNTAETMFNPGTLSANTTYYWQVNEVTDEETIEGEIWSFTTRAGIAPQKASNPYPANGAVDLFGAIEKMTWDMDVTIADTSKLYLSTQPDSLSLVQTYSMGGYKPGPFSIRQTYYWRVDLSNQFGEVVGDLWQFSMKESYYSKPDYCQMDDAQGIISIEVEDFTDSTNIGEHYWALVTNPGDYSGTGAMQVLPDNGTFYNTRYSERSSMHKTCLFTMIKRRLQNEYVMETRPC